MNDRQSGYVQTIGRRVEYILRKLKDVADWQRWAEQRIREMNFGAPQLGLSGGGGDSNYFDTAVIAKATGLIGARSGATYGSGTVKLQADGGTSLSDYSPTTTFTAKNILDRTIASGAWVICVRVGSSWWITATGSCDDLG